MGKRKHSDSHGEITVDPSQRVDRVVVKMPRVHDSNETTQELLQAMKEIIEQQDGNELKNTPVLFEVLQCLNSYISDQIGPFGQNTGNKMTETITEIQGWLKILLDKTLNSEYNNMAYQCLLKVIQSWEYFASISVLPNIRLIKSKKLRKFMSRVVQFGDEQCKNEMYNLALFNLKIKVCKEEDISFYFSLVPDIANCQINLIENFPIVLDLMTNDQIRQLALDILTNILEDTEEYNRWSSLAKTGDLNNLRFIVALISEIFKSLRQDINNKTLKKILDKTDYDLLFQGTNCDVDMIFQDSCQELRNKIFRLSQKKLSQSDTLKIQNYVKILLDLGIEYMQYVNLKKIVCMLLFLISESSDLEEVWAYRFIYPDLVLGSEQEFATCIIPQFFLNEKYNGHMYDQLFIHALTDQQFVDHLDVLLASDSFEMSHATTLWKCVETAKNNSKNLKACPKLNELCNKLGSRILEQGGTPMTDLYQIRILTLKLNETKNPDELLKTKVIDTMRHLLDLNFNQSNNESTDNEWSLLYSIKQLAIAALNNGICMDLKKDILTMIYTTDVSIKVNISTLFKIFDRDDYNKYFAYLKDQFSLGMKARDPNPLRIFISHWEDIVQANNANHKICVDNLSKTLQKDINLSLSQFDQDSWDMLFKLFHTIIATPKFSIDGTILYAIMSALQKYLKQDTVQDCTYPLQFCSELFVYRAELAETGWVDVLDIFEMCIHHIIKLARQSGKDKSPEMKLMLKELEKVAIVFHKNKAAFITRFIPSIANCMKYYCEGFVPPFTKESLQTVLDIFFSTFDQYAVPCLKRSLPGAEKAAFDAFYITYKKHCKFTGEI